MINRSKMLSTGRFQIGRFVQFSASRFFVFHHQDLVSQQGLPCIHLCSLSTWQGLPKRGFKDNCREPGRVPRSRLRVLVSYWNNNVCSYTTASNSKRNVNDNRPHFLQNITTSNARTFSIVPVALLVIIGAGLLVHYNDERRAIPREQDTKRNVQNALSKPSIGGPFKLINYEGKVVTDRDFLGHWTLIYFGYTSSPDVGPDEVQKLARAVDLLGEIAPKSEWGDDAEPGELAKMHDAIVGGKEPGENGKGGGDDAITICSKSSNAGQKSINDRQSAMKALHEIFSPQNQHHSNVGQSCSEGEISPGCLSK